MAFSIFEENDETSNIILEVQKKLRVLDDKTINWA